MPNGILIIDKPADWTSMDVCAKVRASFTKSGWATAGPWTPWPPACCRFLWDRPPGAWNLPRTGRRNTWQACGWDR